MELAKYKHFINFIYEFIYDALRQKITSLCITKRTCSLPSWCDQGQVKLYGLQKHIVVINCLLQAGGRTLTRSLTGILEI